MSEHRAPAARRAARAGRSTMGADEAIGAVALGPACAAAEPPAGLLPTPSPVAAAGSAAPAPPSRAIVAPPRMLAESLAEAAQSARAARRRRRQHRGAGGAGRRRSTAARLKRTATNTVFIDGNPAAPVMIVGEAPGADEDRIGRPFVGRAGQLLDRMLAAIGLDRSGRADHQRRSTGGRPATASRPPPRPPPACPSCCATSRWRGPRCWCCAGGTAASTLLPVSDGITRLRGRWFELAVPGLDAPVPTLPMFHPAFLLRAPEQETRSLARPAGA